MAKLINLKAELLSCGYVKTNHNRHISMDIIKVIESFYDIYLYWTIQKDEMKRFLSAKNGDEIPSPSKCTIKGTESEWV